MTAAAIAAFSPPRCAAIARCSSWFSAKRARRCCHDSGARMWERTASAEPCSSRSYSVLSYTVSKPCAAASGNGRQMGERVLAKFLGADDRFAGRMSLARVGAARTSVPSQVSFTCDSSWCSQSQYTSPRKMKEGATRLTAGSRIRGRPRRRMSMQPTATWTALGRERGRLYSAIAQGPV
jgi:hypothetical protein